MPFRCPQCLTPDSLDIEVSIELPRDLRAHEISLQVIACSACSFTGLAVYEASNRGELGLDNWRHTGYWVSPDSVQSVRQAIQSCPNQHDPHCKCQAHTSLGQKDVYGMWSGLLEMKSGHTFSMRWFLG